MVGQHNCRIFTCPLDDDSNIAPGTPLCLAYSASLWLAPWCGHLVDVLHPGPRCVDCDDIRFELGLFSAEYRDEFSFTNNWFSGSMLPTARSGGQTLTAS